MHIIYLAFRESYLRRVQGNVAGAAYQQFQPHAEVQISEDSDLGTIVRVTLEQCSIGEWLHLFHQDKPDGSGGCQRYRILEIYSIDGRFPSTVSTINDQLSHLQAMEWA